MSAVLVLKRQCSRCPREIEEAVTVQEAAARLAAHENQPPFLRIEYEGTEVVSHSILCPACQETVAKLIGSISKELQHRSPRVAPEGRLRKNKDDGE